MSPVQTETHGGGREKRRRREEKKRMRKREGKGGCFSYFPACSVTNTMTKTTYRRVYLDFQFQRVRIHGGRAKA